MSKTYIIRIMGEDEEYEVTEEILNEINLHDNKIVKNVEKAKKILNEIHNEIAIMQKLARKGKKVELKKSDFVIPYKDITLDEAIEYFEGEGIIPG